MRSQHLGLTIYLVIFINFSRIYCIVDRQEFGELDRRLNALWKVVDYMARRPEQMNVDAIFGLTLAEAHLRATLIHSNLTSIGLDHQNILRNIMKLCDKARRFMKKNIKSESKNTAKFNEILNHPENWIHPIVWKMGDLEIPTWAKFNMTFETVKNLIFNGTPTEEESDVCISSILDKVSTKSCKIPTKCEIMLLRNDNPKGYALTHRVLLIWIASTFNCDNSKIISYAELISKYCSLILQNLVDLESLGFPPPSTDLACEEVLICGSKGYLEFANDHYANLIINWQHPRGCYNPFITNKLNGPRKQRSTNETDFGCQNHATGLGAAALALLIRQYIDTAIFI